MCLPLSCRDSQLPRPSSIIKGSNREQIFIPLSILNLGCTYIDTVGNTCVCYAVSSADVIDFDMKSIARVNILGVTTC